MTKITIKETNWGIAYRRGNTIWVNPALYNYPIYFKEVIHHELNHSDNPGLTWNDFLLDFDIIPLKGQVKFFIENPVIMLQAITPVWYDSDENSINYNGNLILQYIILLSLYGLLIHILG